MKKLLMLSVLLLAACEPSSPMVGKWQGANGAWIDVLDTENGTYGVMISDASGPITLGGTLSKDGRIYFQRNGINESIRPGTGKEAGVKELAEKQNCIIIKTGEGYCRD